MEEDADFPIKYEDLVENFEEQIQGINRFLELILPRQVKLEVTR